MTNTTISLSTYYLKIADIDNALSTTSTHPVQNKVLTTELNKKINKTDLITELNNIITELNTL